MQRIERKGEEPCYQPQMTREACHMLWEMGQEKGEYMTVVLNAIIVEAHRGMMEEKRIAEELVRQEALVESGFSPTVFVRGPGEEEYRPVLPLATEKAR